MRWIHNDEHSLVEDPKGVVIATVHFPVYGALISASPALLEALELARLHFDELQQMRDGPPRASTVYVVAQVDAAIALARAQADSPDLGDEDRERGPDMGDEDRERGPDMGDEDREKGPDMGDEDPEPDPLLGK